MTPITHAAANVVTGVALWLGILGGWLLGDGLRGLARSFRRMR